MCCWGSIKRRDIKLLDCWYIVFMKLLQWIVPRKVNLLFYIPNHNNNNWTSASSKSNTTSLLSSCGWVLDGSFAGPLLGYEFLCGKCSIMASCWLWKLNCSTMEFADWWTNERWNRLWEWVSGWLVGYVSKEILILRYVLFGAKTGDSI